VQCGYEEVFSSIEQYKTVVEPRVEFETPNCLVMGLELYSFGSCITMVIRKLGGAKKTSWVI
jgi:hypothetical protein